MHRSRAAIRSALIVLALGLVVPSANAQLKSAQERGYSNLKDGYALIASMVDNKSNRTRGNFDTSLGKLLTSMADMSPYIDRMGERVADEDKSYANGLKSNIQSAWRTVADTHGKVRSAYDAAKDSPEKLAEISDELKALKAALEQYDVACKAAYDNYKSKWDDLQKETQRVEADVKSAREKADAIEKRDDDMYKESQRMQSDLDRAIEEYQKLLKPADELEITWLTTKRNREQAMRDGKRDDYKRLGTDLEKIYDLQARMIDMKVAAMDKRDAIAVELKRKEQDRAKNWRDMPAALAEVNKLDPLKAFERFTLWDTEFPARSYSYQSMR